MSGKDNKDQTPAEIIATLRNSGWSKEDLKAVPRLNELLDDRS